MNNTTPTKIKVLNGGKGQVPNPWTQYDENLSTEWHEFDKANPAYDIIGPLSVKVGETVDAELIYQERKHARNHITNKIVWFNVDEERWNKTSEKFKRQAWQLTPEKEGEEKPCPYVHTLEYLQNRVIELENTTGEFIDQYALNNEISYYKTMIERKNYKSTPANEPSATPKTFDAVDKGKDNDYLLIAKFIWGEPEDEVWYRNKPVLNTITLSGGSHHIKQLCFSTSWDWLMPVVEKIDSLGGDAELILNTEEVVNSLLSVDIDTAYKAAVKFIQWYNLKNS